MSKLSTGQDATTSRGSTMRKVTEQIKAAWEAGKECVYVIEEIGDDYHGNRLISAHADEAEAELQAAHLERTQVKTCGASACTHRYSYHVTRVPYTTQCGHVMTGASTSVTHASPR